MEKLTGYLFCLYELVKWNQLYEVKEIQILAVKDAEQLDRPNPLLFFSIP